MPGYKVSYKVLRQQGDDIKVVAKLVDGYMERVAQIRGKLGDDSLLAEVRNNFGKLSEQLGESRTVLNTAGEFLVKTVDNYTGVEVRQVKKVDGTKAHTRDFYKNPIVVATAGGSVAAATTAATPASATTVNYTDNSVHITYASEPAAAPSPAVESPAVVNTVAAPAPAVAAVNTAAEPASAVAAASTGAKSVVGGVAGIAAGVGVAGGAIGAGAVIGVKHLINEDKKAKSADTEEHQPNNAADGYNPEAELKKAIQRVKDLESE